MKKRRCFLGAIERTAEVFSSVTPVFVQKGGDVTLEVTETDVPEGFELLLWKFGANNVLVSFTPKGEPNVRPNYSGRIEFNKKNYSVKLKNLQKTDSGVYTARVIGAQEKSLEYNVTVQDPVSAVQLTVNSVSNSSDSCNLTVTCSTEEHSQISSTFTCDTKTCYQEGGERSEITKSGASLHFYLSDESIICNHSNQVSQKHAMIKIQDHCPRHDASPVDRNHLIIVVPIIVVFFGGLVVGGVCYKQRKGKYNREDAENTEYAVPQIKPVPDQGENSADDASGLSPTTTYSMIGRHTQMGSTENGGTPAESVYAQVQKPIVT
ncbi:SLAM family member 5-like isoform 2-T2 [Odontesthes bonariensis]|uniref:SLAM family member 5-like isoform X2 n=1 Tax=Odontesthes bonariensis TaxID=219752 RepID=UPI003F5806D7